MEGVEECMMSQRNLVAATFEGGAQVFFSNNHATAVEDKPEQLLSKALLHGGKLLLCWSFFYFISPLPSNRNN